MPLRNPTMTYIFREESFLIQGAIFEVYKEIGVGFLEAVYQECLIREFTFRKIPFVSQPEFEISYKGEKIPLTYRPDFVCYNKIIVELKAARDITDEFRAQIHNYLRISGFKLGLLVNFGNYPKVAIERIVY